MATLISTYGGKDSNAYISVSDATSFICTSIFDPTAWTSATSIQQCAAILQATKDVDSRQYIGPRIRDTR